MLHMLLYSSLILILVISILITTNIILDPPRGETFTELYLLGGSGKANSYPHDIDLGQQMTVTVGVVNHEYQDMEYDLVVMLNNGANKEQLYSTNLSLADNATWQKPLDLKPTIDGARMKLDFLLYANGNTTVPYRTCYLFINVTDQYAYLDPKQKRIY